MKHVRCLINIPFIQKEKKTSLFRPVSVKNIMELCFQFYYACILLMIKITSFLIQQNEMDNIYEEKIVISFNNITKFYLKDRLCII